MTLTPEQFNKLATKEDLEKFVIKEDLKKLEISTKENIKKLEISTKENIKELEEKMDKKFDAAFDVFASKEDLKELRQEMASKEDINKILTAIDGIAKKHQDFEAELAANQGAHDRFEERFTKTDERIKVVEEKFEASPVVA